MNQKTKYKSARLNAFVTILCLLVFFISVWLFFKDLTSSSYRTDKNAVATISFKYKIAQRKFNDRVVWEHLRQGTSLYNGDTIRTADLAKATIYFADGTNIDIGENTMVQVIVTDSGEVKLSVNNGDIEIDTTSSSNSILLEMGTDLTINLESGSKISAKVDDSKTDVGLNVKAGNASITQSKTKTQQTSNATNTTNVEKNNSAQKISAGESVKISKNGKVTKKPLTVTSVAETQQVLVFDEKQKNNSVSLEWFPLENANEKVIVQTSNSKNFSKIKDTITVENTNKAVIPVEDKTIYWRIFPENNPENPTEGKLILETVPQVTTIFPEENKTFNYYKEKPTINFAWHGNKYSTKYKIEVSENPNLKNPILTKEVTTKNVSIPDLPDGKYYWAITPYYETNGIGWYGETETKSFTISKRTKLLPPTLSIPTDGKTFAYTDKIFDAEFSWKGENVDSEYTLQIAKDKNFSNVLLALNTNKKSINKSLSVSDFPDGEYFWKITQKTKDAETATLVSETRKFTVAKYVQENDKLLYPADNYSVEASNLSSMRFLWKISPESEKLYEKEKTKLQISTSKDFSNLILEKEVTGTSVKNIKLNSGKYFWRIKKGNIETTPQTIFVLEKLEKPNVTSLKANSKMLLKKDQDVTIEWEKNPDADFYNVKLLNANTNKIIMESSELKSAKMTIPSKFISNEEQNFKVQIQAITNETKLSAIRKSEISELNFSAKLVSLPKLVSPAQNTKIDGLSAVKNGVNLKWTKGADPYSSATLKLWKVGNGGQLKLIESYKNPRENVNVPKLSEGTYRWTINAVNKDGISLDAEETRDFVITEIPLLTKPNLESPQENQIFDAEYFKENRSITFNWKSVKDATDYTFVLYQKLPDGKLKQVYSSKNQKSTQVKIKDLSILDIGTFQWQVTAQNRAKDGFVYQDGNVAQQNFKIDFSLTKSVKTVDPGELYGE